MPKLVVQHETDPSIGVVFDEVFAGDGSNRAPGYHGRCTECGHVMHRWLESSALKSGARHVEQHESGL